MYNTTAILQDGTLIFTATTCYVPQIGSQLEIAEHIYTVQDVRYKIQEGVSSSVNVVLTLV